MGLKKNLFSIFLVLTFALTGMTCKRKVKGEKRLLPKHIGNNVTLSAPIRIRKGTTFDGGMKVFGRGVKCTGQKEGGRKDAVFIVEEGATLKNAIIGPDQIEGVHCHGSCTIENVWWEDVCEDALTIKSGNGTYNIIGGGANHADDKVIQHNSGGVVNIHNFTVNNFGKLYRSCGNCRKQYQRTVILNNVTAVKGKTLVGINENYGDTAKIMNTCATRVRKICVEYKGNDKGKEPKEIRNGPSKNCVYSEPLVNC